MYSCVIIDDEPHAIEGLEKYIKAVPCLKVVASFEDSVQALSELKKSDPVDIIFLDIDMPKINGLELSKEIRMKTNKLIFTTGHTKYGYEAFKADADDYLLKPYTLGEFIISMDKLLPGQDLNEKLKESDFFFVRSKEHNGRMISIKYVDVVVVESKLNYITIYTQKKNFTTHISLTEMYKILTVHPGFLQFHRSYIIAQNHIEYLEGNSVRMSNGLEITIREYYKKSFNEFVSKLVVKARMANPPR